MAHRLTTVPAHRCRIAALVITGLLIGTGCAADPKTPQDSASHSPAPTATHTAAPPTKASGPVTSTAGLVLPLERFYPNITEGRKIDRAVITLADRCMQGFGLRYQPGQLPLTGPTTLVQRRYTELNERIVAAYGFKMPNPGNQPTLKEPQGDEVLVLLGGQLSGPSGDNGETPATSKPLMYKNKVIPSGGCLGQARRDLSSAPNVPWDQHLAIDLGLQTYKASKQRPEVQAVFRAWTSCMKAKGFHYPADPMSATDDPKFQTSNSPSPQEIRTALADTQCAKQVNLVGIWFAAESDLQNRAIAVNRSELSKSEAEKAHRLQKADTISGST